jgi:signal transduction histidine kinase
MQLHEKSLALTLNITDDLFVSGNSEALEELFSNLIGNAVRYTPQNGKIQIKASRANQSGFVCFSVSDSGIGIDPEEAPHIFEDFYRAKNAEIMEKNGTGLGLSIAKQIVEAHDGSIWLESDPGKGTTFYIKLPQC